MSARLCLSRLFDVVLRRGGSDRLTKRFRRISICSPTTSSPRACRAPTRGWRRARLRRRRADQGAVSRQRGLPLLEMLARTCGSRPPDAQEPGVLADRGRLAGAQHRRAHGGVQRRQRGRAQAAANRDPGSVYFLQTASASWSYPDYRDLRDRVRDTEALAGYRIAMMNVGLGPTRRRFCGATWRRVITSKGSASSRRPDDSSRRLKTRRRARHRSR